MLRRRKLRKVCLGRALHACVSLADSAQTAWLSITSRSHQLFVVSGNVTRSGIVVTHVPQQSKLMMMSTIVLLLQHHFHYNNKSIPSCTFYIIDSLVMPFITLIRSSNLPILYQVLHTVLHKTKIHIKSFAFPRHGSNCFSFKNLLVEIIYFYSYDTQRK